MRIADLRVLSKSKEASDGTAAFALSAQAAYNDPSGCELATAATASPLRKTDPVFLLDP
jgi:hypothetical protein